LGGKRVMDIFDIFIAYVSWNGSGKKRPVLVLDCTTDSVAAFNITTQYGNKSEAVRANYFKINDWRQAGLNRQSYVDTNAAVILPLSSVDIAHPVGALTESDVREFIEFLPDIEL
jgi:hypothetical protein